MSDVTFPHTTMADFDYKMVGPFRTVFGPTLFNSDLPRITVFERFQDAVNQFVADCLPVTHPECAVIQDGRGKVVLGYTESDERVNGMHWWGTAEGYAVLAAHPDVAAEDVVLWELEAKGDLDDLTRLS